MEIYDYSLDEKGLWADETGSGLNLSADLETVAAVLHECGHTDGYTLKNGAVVCLMDERPGFSDICTVQSVWETLTGDQKEAVAQKCLQ